MIRTATRNDLPALLTLAGAVSDSPYDLRAVAEEKCFGEGASGHPLCRLYEIDGVARGVAVRCGRYLRLLAVDPAFRRRGIGTALLRDATPEVIAAEPGNYFTPGVSADDAGSMAFLARHGFRPTGQTWNLRARTGAGGSGVILEAIPPSAALMEFVRREFGGIWAFEVSRARSAVWIEDVGFAVVEANNRGLGTFGPAGVARQARRQGHGRALLLAALAELGRLGYDEALIPWTDDLEFYRRSCGAEPAHRFLRFAIP